MKLFFRILQGIIICVAVVFMASNSSNIETMVTNDNLNKTVDLEAMALKVSEFDNVVSSEIAMAEEETPANEQTDTATPSDANVVLDYSNLDESLNTPANKLTGQLTGYVFNCPACSGVMACTRYNITDGTTTYPDPTYGNVNIVASSGNLPCGSIVQFDGIYAIVLDRGVLGNDLDLLMPSYQAAISQGRRTITYDVLRYGY